MSKQLTLSATIAVASMALFVALTSLGGSPAQGPATGAPQFELTVTR